MGIISNEQDGKSQVGALSKAQIKSEGDPLETKKIRKKSRTVPKKHRKGGPFGPVRFCRLRLESKNHREDPLEYLKCVSRVFV